MHANTETLHESRLAAPRLCEKAVTSNQDYFFPGSVISSIISIDPYGKIFCVVDVRAHERIVVLPIFDSISVCNIQEPILLSYM